MTGAAAAPGFAMWMTFVLIAVTLFLYTWERIAIEVTSVGVLCALMLFFQLMPQPGADGRNLLGPERIIEGFANSALLTVLALLVVGQGMVRAGVLDRGARVVMVLGGGYGRLTVIFTLVVVLVVSGFLNNIPVVVIFIPIMEAVAAKFNESTSKVMMPLSFAAVLGGMTTLVGSGTNLLVSGSLVEIGETPLGFFEFTIPGLVLAGVGFVVVVLVIPRLLPDRAPYTQRLFEGEGRHYIAQIQLAPGSALVGATPTGGFFPALTDMTVRLVQRDEEAFLPPFEDLALRAGDVLVVAATRHALTDAIAGDPGLLVPDLDDGVAGEEQRWQAGERMLAEVMVRPASSFTNQSLRQVGFRHRTHCVVLAIQRRSRMLREKLTDIRLLEGDVLLVQGQPEDIAALRHFQDIVLLEGSASELPALEHAKRASLIFAAVIFAAASGMVPVVVATMAGALAMVATGALSVRQAVRALDSKIFTMIPAALAMGLAMEETGGAAFLAHGLVGALSDAGAPVILSAFFLLTAVLSNAISAKATAVLFTPIAVGIARELGVPVDVFAIAVVFAANCALATPIGYQTSLLVMGPGHYTFADFLRGGVPLIIVLWVTFSLFAPWYYGL